MPPTKPKSSKWKTELINSVAEELAASIVRLRDAGVESAQLEAQMLLAHGLRCSRLDIITHPERLLSAEELSSFRDMVDMRARRCPLAYIIGQREFFGLQLIVTPAVLIPRAETEILVEEVLRRLPDHAIMADVGTGSGAIAVAVAVNAPKSEICAIDLSEEALSVACANAVKHGVANRVNTLQGDLLEGLFPGQIRFDVIVSNPPYIPTRDIDTLEIEVRSEPLQALDGGEDGLDIYRRLFVQAAKLTDLIVVEMGTGQSVAITQIANEAGWGAIEIIRDLAGIERVLVARP